MVFGDELGVLSRDAHNGVKAYRITAIPCCPALRHCCGLLQARVSKQRDWSSKIWNEVHVALDFVVYLDHLMQKRRLKGRGSSCLRILWSYYKRRQKRKGNGRRRRKRRWGERKGGYWRRLMGRRERKGEMNKIIFLLLYIAHFTVVGRERYREE